MEKAHRPLIPDVCKLQLPNHQKTVYKRYGKPPYSYAGMIIAAIMTSPANMLTLSQVHDYLRNMFDFFKQPYMGWKDSVRHNLSHCKCFIKAGKTVDGKNNYWAVDLSNVTPSLFRRQHTAVAKDGNYAEDLHDELQIPRTEIPFFNYARGSSVRHSEDRSSSPSSIHSYREESDSPADADSMRFMPVSDQKRASSVISFTGSSSTNSSTEWFPFADDTGPPTPLLCSTMMSGTSARSPIVIESPVRRYRNPTTVRPPSALSRTSSSVSLRALSDQSDRCFSPAFSEISSPRTPCTTEADNMMSDFRPIDSGTGHGEPSGWITPIGMVRDGSDMSREASCLSDTSPAKSDSVRRAPKRKLIRHRPKAQKTMKIDAGDSFSKTQYAELQMLVASSAQQWEVSLDKAVNNLRVLCQSSAEASATGNSVLTVFHQHNPSLDSMSGRHTPERTTSMYSGHDQQMTITTGSGDVCIQTTQIQGQTFTDSSDQTGQHYGNLRSFRRDHTYSSPERESPRTITTAIEDAADNSLDEFASCAIWYGFLNST